MKKAISVFVAVFLCCSAMSLVGCTSDQKSASSVNTSAADFPAQETIVDTWKRPDSIEGYTFNADGTGEDFTLGSFTYTLEYKERQGEEDGSFSVSGWVLHISYDKLPAGKTMWVIFSEDTNTMTTWESSENTFKYTRD